MRMFVPHGFVPVPVRVRFGDRTVVNMLMMGVMHVGMVVLKRFVVMLMIVPLRQVQP